MNSKPTPGSTWRLCGKWLITIYDRRMKDVGSQRLGDIKPGDIFFVVVSLPDAWPSKVTEFFVVCNGIFGWIELEEEELRDRLRMVI